MKPVIAIVGRPNVGKSTLFNKLTRTRDALVADEAGLTRDRQYGNGKTGDRPYIVVDTGGLADDSEGLSDLITGQALQAAREADALVFLVDGRSGIAAGDENIAARLRALGKPVHLAVNKAEGMDPELVCVDFHALALGKPHPISSARGSGLGSLMDAVLDSVPDTVAEDHPEDDEGGIRVAVLGKPNVGKSTLVNRMLGEDRVLAFDQPGTTRDSIATPFERDNKRYTLIDTAGVRRRSRLADTIEKFSVIKTLKAIDKANVVILVIDARDSVSDQDASLLGMILDSGKALLIAVNKWDGMEASKKQRIRDELDRKFRFIDFARVHYISALHGTGVGNLFKSINKAYESAFIQATTSRLTRILEEATSAHPPPMVQGRRIKLRYAHMGGHNPPRVLIHGNQIRSVPDSYRRYLANRLRKVLQLEGTPVQIEFRSSENPYKGRKNKLTPRQIKRRKRLMQHVKKH